MTKLNRQKEKGAAGHKDFLLADTLSIVISFVISYFIKFGDFSFLKSEAWTTFLFISVLVNLIVCIVSDPYSGIFKRPYYEEIVKSLLLTVYDLVLSAVIFYVFKIGAVFSRQTILVMYAFYFLISLVLKCIWKKLILSKKVKIYTAKKTSLFVIAETGNANDVLRRIGSSDFDTYEIKGICLADDDSGKSVCGIPAVKNIADVCDFVINNSIDEILLFSNPEIFSKNDCEKLVSNNVVVHFALEKTVPLQGEDSELSTIGIINTLSTGKYNFTDGQRVYLVVKRIIDFFAGLLGIILLIPVTAVIKIVYVVTGDRGKVFYRQPRVGKDGKTIKIWKYRTMVENADEILENLLEDENTKIEWEKNQKLSDDPRITKFGKFLRRTSIDELPQLINVFKGDMSLVGPRPLVEGELESHNGMKLYNLVKPGITGWWGCNGRSGIDYRERLELEYYYVKNFSVYLDFLCVLRSVVTVLSRKGAE